MNRLATTTLSSKGQISLPEEVRKNFGFHAGDQFIILAEKGVVTLKCITKPSIDDYNNLIAKTRKAAKTAGLTKDALKKIIKDVRKK